MPGDIGALISHRQTQGHRDGLCGALILQGLEPSPWALVLGRKSLVTSPAELVPKRESFIPSCRCKPQTKNLDRSNSRRMG